MAAKVLQYVISILFQFLTADMLRQFADMVLDFIENTVAKSETKVDDQIMLPLCDLIRSSFNVPDNDEAPPA